MGGKWRLGEDFKPTSTSRRKFSNRSPRLHQIWQETYPCLPFRVIGETDLRFMNGELRAG